MEEKPYCPCVSVVWWHGYGDYRGFPKSSDLGGTDQKSCSFWPAETGDEGYRSASSNLLPN